jgi:hypothetical protein
MRLFATVCTASLQIIKKAGEPVLLILTPILALSLEVNDSNSYGVIFEESTLLIV